MFIIILCGGVGKRLWPDSTVDRPKQFLTVFDNVCLLEKTIRRAIKAESPKIILIASANHKQSIEAVCSGYNIDKILYEPCLRNTAPAICLGINYIVSNYDYNYNEPVYILPADHYFDETFSWIFSQPVDPDMITLVGIEPTYAETGYGYIEANNGNIVNFIEKPNKVKAEQLIAIDNMYWNSGIFIGHIPFFRDVFQKFASGIWDGIMADPSLEKYHMLDNISFDYAIMEKLKSGKLIPFSGVWSDLGDFDRIYNLHTKDGDGNVILGDVEVTNCTNCFIKTDKKIKISDQHGSIVISCDGNLLIKKF